MLKMLLNFFLEIFFDHKDEYNFKSEKFNIVKVLTLFVLIVSMILNFFLMSSYFELATKYFSALEKIELLENPTKPEGKN